MAERYADEVSAKELHLFINNDVDLYRQQHIPIIKSLVAKKARGVYDSRLAAKAFGYLVDSGAKKYYAEYGSDPRGMVWSAMFPKKLRDAIAEELRDDFETEFSLGNYDGFIPKKYQPKPPKVRGVIRKRGGARKSKSPATMPPIG